MHGEAPYQPTESFNYSVTMVVMVAMIIIVIIVIIVIVTSCLLNSTFKFTASNFQLIHIVTFLRLFRFINMSIETNTEANTSELIYINFSQFEDLNIIAHALTITDLDSKHPRCTVNGLEFTGDYEINLGTKLFFEVDTAEYRGKVEKRLNFKLTKVDCKNENSSHKNK